MTLSASDKEETEIKQHILSAKNLTEAIEDSYVDEIILDRAVKIDEDLEIKNSLKLDANKSTLKDLVIEDNTIKLEGASTGAVLSCIIITDLNEKNTETLKAFAQKLSDKNEFKITNDTDYRVLIQKTNENLWPTLVGVKADGSIS